MDSECCVKCDLDVLCWFTLYVWLIVVELNLLLMCIVYE